MPRCVLRPVCTMSFFSCFYPYTTALDSPLLYSCERRRTGNRGWGVASFVLAYILLIYPWSYSVFCYGNKECIINPVRSTIPLWNIGSSNPNLPRTQWSPRILIGYKWASPNEEHPSEGNISEFTAMWSAFVSSSDRHLPIIAPHGA